MNPLVLSWGTGIRSPNPQIHAGRRLPVLAQNPSLQMDHSSMSNCAKAIQFALLSARTVLRYDGASRRSCQNLILRNVMRFDINHGILEAGDALTLSKASGVWLDHITFKWVSDSCAEIQAGTEKVTISYALFEGGTVAECGGQERWGMTITDAQVTIHHSRFDQLSTHAPVAQGSAARVHLFNNVYSNSANWTVGSSCLAQVLLEGSVFENVEVVSRISNCSGTAERGLINAVTGSNVYRDGAAVPIGGDGNEPHDAVFVPLYEYDAELGTTLGPK